MSERPSGPGMGRRWAQWIGVWLGLLLALRLLFGWLLPPILPEHFLWSGAFALASALTFFLVPSPVDGV